MTPWAALDWLRPSALDDSPSGKKKRQALRVLVKVVEECEFQNEEVPVKEE